MLHINLTDDKKVYSLLDTLFSIMVELNGERYQFLYDNTAGGQKGVLETVIEWVLEFEAKNEERFWDGEFWEEIAEFVDQKLAEFRKENLQESKQTLTFILPSIEDVEFELYVRVSDIPITGNVSDSGDCLVDRNREYKVRDRLNDGDTWAWADVTLTAKWKSFKGVDHLGACSYKDTTDFKLYGPYSDMKGIAYHDLISSIQQAFA